MTAEKVRHAADVLIELASRGITLSIREDALHCHAPKGALTAALRTMLLEHKAELLAFLRAQQETAANHAGEARPKLERITHQGYYQAPLSFAQQRLWFLNQLQPESATYNIAVAVRIQGPLLVSVLVQSLNEVVRRHESLRTTFAVVADRPVQVVAPAPPAGSVQSVPVVMYDLVALSTQEQEKHLQQLASQEARLPFDLARGPLLRATFLQLSQEERVLLLTLHHIIADGWSLGILVRELLLLYQTYTSGQPSPLSELPIQYSDYVRWQRKWLQDELLQAQLDYWKKQLAGVPLLLALPLDYPRPAVQTFQGATFPVFLPLSLVEALKQLSQREGVTLFMTLLAAFQVLLSRSSRQEDIVVGTPVANRTHAETEALIGLFVNMLVLRSHLAGNLTFLELLRQVRDVAQAAYTHQDVPFEQVVEALQPKRDMSYTPLFQVTLVLQRAPLQHIELGEIRLQPLPVEHKMTKFDLTLNLEEGPTGLEGTFEYSTDLFKHTTIARMAGHWSTLLQAIVAEPRKHIWEYPLLSERERQQLLEWSMALTYPLSTSTIHALFEAQVERSPDAVAIVYADQYLTYRALNTRAQQLASVLHGLGVEPEGRVSVCMERSLDLVVALLSILKVGGAYVPLDPTHPKERLAFMVEDTQSRVVLTQQPLVEQFFADTARFRGSHVVSLDSFAMLERELLEQEEAGVPQRWRGPASTLPQQLAYVIYTSGSTGRPKGVAVSHQNLVHLVAWHHQAFHLSPADRTTQLAGVGFDASAWEIWPSLLAGASLHVPTEATRISPQTLQEWLIAEAVTLTFLPTPLAEHMLTLTWPSALPLRIMLTGGDRLHHAPPAGLPFTLVNNYGPTENTVVTTSGMIVPQAAEHRVHPSLNPTIGRPIANTQTYLLDQAMQPVPIGVPGELYIGGAGLARGYLHHPVLTAERFVPDPFVETRFTEPGSRLYRSGDLARYRPDGSIEFLGRLDQQVKLRGFRIELGEIEALLNQHPAVRESVVLLREKPQGEKYLIAYIVACGQQSTPSLHELRRFLQTSVPDYMVPSDFVVLDALPLTANGKVDYHALSVTHHSQPALETTFVAPRDPWELHMVHIWETLLEKHPIGVRDDFFAIGGHSLLVVALMAQIHTHFGQHLPLAALFQEATVEHLVRLLREANMEEAKESEKIALRQEAWSPLIPIQPHGSQHPFFCVHGADGTVLGYRALSQHLGPDQPFYGLQAKGVEDAQEPLTDIAAMAACYVQAVCTQQPEGPYLLGGWSMGGLIAFEMAQQLTKKNHQVALVVLFDTWLDVDTRGEIAPRDGWEFLRDDVPFSTELVRDLIQKDVSLSLFNQFNAKQLEAIRQAFRLSAGSGVEQAYRLLQVYQANRRASQNYVPQTYRGRVLLFACKEQPAGPFDRLQSSWAAAVPQALVFQPISGDHYSMLDEPCVQFVAESLRSWLLRYD